MADFLCVLLYVRAEKSAKALVMGVLFQGEVGNIVPPNLPLKEGVTSTTLLKQLSEAGWVKIIYFDTDQTLSVLLIFQFFTQKLQMKIEHVPNYTYL